MPLSNTGDPDVPTLSERLMALAGWVLLLYALGTLPFLVVSPGPDYIALHKPELRPPLSWYPQIWAGLYVSLALALWLMRLDSEMGDARIRRASLLFAVQYTLHLLWAPLLFGLNAPLWLAICLGAMLPLVLATTIAFARIRLLSALPMLPWLLWVGYGLWFYFALWRMNAG